MHLVNVAQWQSLIPSIDPSETLRTRIRPGGALFWPWEAFSCKALTRPWPWQEVGAARGRAAAGAVGARAAVEAAEAAEALGALEALLPESVEGLVGLVRAHAACPGRRFAARQLLALAAGCGDLADASGRRAAGELLQVVPHLLRARVGWAAHGVGGSAARACLTRAPDG